MSVSKCRVVPVSDKSCIVDNALYHLDDTICEEDFRHVLGAVHEVWHPEGDMFLGMFGTSSLSVPGRQQLHSLCVRVLRLNCVSFDTNHITLCSVLRQFVACWYQQQYANSTKPKFVPCVSLFRFQEDGGRVIREVDNVRHQLSGKLDFAQDQAKMQNIIREICNISTRYRSAGYTFRVIAADEVSIFAVGAPKESACPKFISMEPITDPKDMKMGFMSVEDTMDMMVYFITNRKSHEVLSRFEHHLSALSYLIFAPKEPISSRTIKTNKHGHRDTYTLAVGLLALILYEWLLPCYENPNCPPTRSALDTLDPHTRKLQQASDQLRQQEEEENC